MVIKIFVPELRIRKFFSCFEIPTFYAYVLWTFYVSFTHIRIMGMVHTDIHTYTHTTIYIFTNPSTQAGYDTRSIFKRSLTELNSEFSFS